MVTSEQRKQIIRGLVDTWDYIGDDILQNIAMEKVPWEKWNRMSWDQRHRAAEAVTMKQADVVCVVTDNWYGKAKENGELWSGLSDTEKASIKKEAFPYKHYGY